MEYAFLGRSGLSVSRLAFGTATFGGPTSAEGAAGRIGHTDFPEAQRIIGRCRDAGINFFDTADVYSAGESETILGKALGAERHQVLIGTKVTLRTGPGQHDLGSSRQHIIRACEDSLRRLGTEWIDLYQLHFPDPLTPINETLRALDDLVRSGKVRYIGCSNFSGAQVVQATMTSDALQIERFISHQIHYSLVERNPEHDMIPTSLEQGVGLLVFGPLANGFLSGKYHRGAPPPGGTRLSVAPQLSTIVNWERAHDVVEVMSKISAARNVPVAEMAINWVLRKPWVSSVLLGARNEAQLETNLNAAEWVLTKEEIRTLDAASEPDFLYPYSVQKRLNPERMRPLTSHSA